MKYWKPILILIVIFGLLALGKIFFFPTPDVANFKQGGPPPPTAVTAYVVKYQALDNQIYATGTLIANEVVNISPEVAGKLIYLNIHEGQFIAKGQLIARVNDADLKAQLKKLEIQLVVAKNKEERAKKLLDIKGLSIEEYEDALNNYNVLNAEIEYVKTLLAKTEIKAPFNGILGFKKVSDGSFVNTSTILTTLQQISPIKVEFSIPEKYITKIKVGNHINFQVDGYTPSYTAKVYAIQPNVDEISRSVVIRAHADNASQQLKPGSFARINLSLGTDENTIMVPTQSIIPILKGQQVFVAKNGEAVPVPVTLGFRGDQKVQITEGLAEGDTVIVTGLMSIKAGSKIAINQITE
ncbi:MAG: efflux RND transporter periplasmic adaptor subunit [Chitinophagales bacterium]|nr:efflux RND transporter periplasmic adaptor subunit [Chitinophagales bacterium]